MNRTRRLARSAALSGTLAGLTSTLALTVAARAEGRGALQPTNSTSHWLNGAGAASVRRSDLRHTAVGFATNWAACLFWALGYEAWVARRRRAPANLLGGALVVSAVAAATDYGPTPRRFTPGWELVLTKRSMAAVYGAMALGLAAGAALADRRR